MKHRVKKIIFYSFGILALFIAAILIYVKLVLPQVGDPEEITIDYTPERYERGKYLANNVAVCIDCHSERDWSLFSGPLVPGTEGQGGEIFDQSMGFPGKFVARNITQFKLREWTDGEILRAITTGVSRDGKALFSIMPHANYGKMDREDIHSIITYIRTLPPIEKEVDPSVPDFPMNFILNTIPKKASFTPMPSKGDKENYGRYLVNTASCFECHTKQEKGKFIGEHFAGGFEFKFPDGSILQSANITPHKTGIGSWSKKDFILRFKLYADSGFVAHKVNPGEFQTPMPWTFYANMTEEDLGSIYDYLQTLKPVDQVVTIFQPADPLKK